MRTYKWLLAKGERQLEPGMRFYVPKRDGSGGSEIYTLESFNGPATQLSKAVDPLTRLRNPSLRATEITSIDTNMLIKMLRTKQVHLVELPA